MNQIHAKNLIVFLSRVTTAIVTPLEIKAFSDCMVALDALANPPPPMPAVPEVVPAEVAFDPAP